MRNKIIGIDARYALRNIRRGIGNYVYHLLCEFREIQPLGLQFILYADSAADYKVIKSFKVNQFQIQILHAPNLAWCEQATLPLSARRDKIDILHCTSNIAPVFFRPCKIVTTIHDVIEFRRQEFGDTKLSLRHRLSRSYRMGVLPKVANISECIITVSEYSKYDIAKVLKVTPEKIRVTYEAPSNACRNQLDILSKALLSRLNIQDGYIFALGAVDRRKNTARLLEAYKKSNITIPLIVAGIENPELFYSFAGEGIHLLGFLPDEVITMLYQNAYFFIYPSLYEGFGLPVLEAMAHGTPVLCSATTSVGEIAADAAIKFNPMDVDDLATKMKLLFINSKLRTELTKKGYTRVAQFSWERCACETLAIYKELLGERN